MGEAILIQRGSGSGEVVSGEVIVEFNNFIPSNVELSEEFIHSTPTALSVARMELVGASVGNYALFAGGVSVDFDMGTIDNSDAVDAYDTSLTRSTPTALSVARMGLAGASVGDYALFAGGVSADFDTGTYDISNAVDAYDTSLTRSTPTALSVARGGLTGASIGDYALFVGGLSDPFSYLFADTVDAYDTSLTRSTPTVLSVARSGIAGASVGNYALFAGGFTLNGMFSSGSDVVDAYDTSLTRSTPTVLSAEREGLAGASVGNYALFAGGFTYPYENFIDAYDTSLTRLTSTVSSVARYGLAGASVGNYALFAGGSAYVETTDAVDIVDAFDTSLTHSTPTVLSVAREGLVGASVGSYALFAGGVSDSSSYLPDDTVDAYSPPVLVARLYTPIGTKYKFGESEETATTNEITVPVPITGYIKFKNGVISNEV